MNKIMFNFAHKFCAFTLAETLIVMGIIGVVAALTIPNLNSSTADKEKVAKVKKVYSNLNDAFGRAQAVYGPFEEWLQLDNTTSAQVTRIGERMTEFLKTSKNCANQVNKGCFTTNIRDNKGTIDGDLNVMNDSNASAYKIILADGSALSFSVFWFGYAATLDIDGPNKGSSTLGKDLFIFYLTDNSVKTISDINGNYDDCFSTGYCAGWVINFDNMDYLKVDSSKKCKNNTSIILDGKTNVTCK